MLHCSTKTSVAAQQTELARARVGGGVSLVRVLPCKVHVLVHFILGLRYPFLDSTIFHYLRKVRVILLSTLEEPLRQSTYTHFVLIRSSSALLDEKYVYLQILLFYTTEHDPHYLDILLPRS